MEMPMTGKVDLILGLSLIFLSYAITSSAEQPLDLTVGSRIRVTLIEPPFHTLMDPKILVGELLSMTATDILLETDADDPPTIIARDNLERLELNTQRGQRKKGALLGGGLGAAVGVLLAVPMLLEDDDPNDWELLPEYVFPLAMGFWGGAVGALIGALVAPGNQWETLDTGNLQLGYDRGRHGENRVYLTLSF
jgi:hypothetical protein